MSTETDIPATDIHTWFGLTYSNYLVLPRTLLQSMPEEWQHRFTAIVDEMQAAFANVSQAEVYKVEAAEEHEYGDLTDAQRARLRIIRHDENFGMDCNDLVTFEDDERMDIEPDERILIPCADPLPHYNRGRTFIAPHLTGSGQEG